MDGGHREPREGSAGMSTDARAIKPLDGIVDDPQTRDRIHSLRGVLPRGGPAAAPRHLLARLRRAAYPCPTGPQLPPRVRLGGLSGRPRLLSASVAYAGILAVPHSLDGPRSHHGHLSGALHALPRAPRPAARDRPQ